VLSWRVIVMRMRRAMTSCVADHFIVEFVRFIVRALQSIQPSAMASRVLSARLSASARLAASRSSLPVRFGARRWMSSPADPATTPKKSSGDLVWIVRCAKIPFSVFSDLHHPFCNLQQLGAAIVSAPTVCRSNPTRYELTRST
jgi:hypothetical protein